MSERAKVSDRIRKKEAEIQSLEDKLRSARVYLQALRDVLKMLEAVDDSAPTESILRPGSLVAQARDLLLEAGHPVHVNELLDLLGKEPTREARASLTSSIAAYVRREEIFTRPAPNTFGLIEFGSLPSPARDPKPPSGFGRPTPADDDDIPF